VTGLRTVNAPLTLTAVATRGLAAGGPGAAGGGRGQRGRTALAVATGCAIALGATAGLVLSRPSEAPSEAAREQPYTLMTEARWPCDEQIEVRLVTESPPGTEVLLRRVVRRLRTATGLRLIVAPPRVRPISGSWPTEEIWVHYVNPPRTDVPGMELAGGPASVVGRGGPQGLGDDITAGKVALRSGTPSNDPTTATATRVLTHELLHTLGVGHNRENRGVMAASGGSSRFSNADRAAIRAVGCPR
jgi:hypothetical protein